TKANRGAIELTIAVPPNLPHIDGDQYQLCQVFTNLLINAFEAMDGRGRIGITASVGARVEAPTVVGEKPVSTPTVIVDVTDSGPGVPIALRDRIFTPFFTTKPQGSGLGLAIVRKIVSAHDGLIDISSSTAGTRFRITLPIWNAAGVFISHKD